MFRHGGLTGYRRPNLALTQSRCRTISSSRETARGPAWFTPLLANIQMVKASEGQAPISGIADNTRTIYLRDGLALSVNVASGTPNRANSNPDTITVYGGAKNDVVNLGAGSDIMVLGGTGELVNDAGSALVEATTALAGALVNGSGKTTLEITNGGTATLNADDDKLIVKLTSATNLTLSTMSFIPAEGSTGTDTIAAMAQGQTLMPGGGAATLIGYSGFGDTFAAITAHLKGTMIEMFGGSELIDLTNLNSATTEPLAYNGSSSAGTLTVTDGTRTANIHFTGDYSPSSFHLATDNHTGLLISFV